MESKRAQLVGNRLALVGTALYFLEWVAIAYLPSVPTDRLGDDTAAIVSAYTGHAGATAFAAGWFSFVLLGRVVFVIALRSAFRRSGVDSPLLDIAVAAMTVSVALEVGSFSLSAAAGWLADANADASAVVALDTAASIGFVMVFAPLAVSVLAASAVMVTSGLFARWLAWLGIAAGVIGIVGGILHAAALGATGTFHELGTAPNGIGVAGFWIWVIAASVVLWRRTPRKEPAAV